MVISGNTMGMIFTVAIVWLIFRGVQESFLARNDTVRQQKHSQFEGMLSTLLGRASFGTIQPRA